MPLIRLEKPQWQPFFDRVSDALAVKRAEIEIVGPGLGTQPEAHSVQLTGLSYDRKDDVFAVIAEDLEHNISHPRQINVDGELDLLRSLEVVDEAGDHHILKLSDPLMLPPPRDRNQ